MLRPIGFIFTLLPLSVVAEEPLLTFEKDVRPILKAHCIHCHGEEEDPDGDVDLRLRRFMEEVTMEAGGQLLVPGHPEHSGLVSIIRSGEMPKKAKKLPDEELAVIEKWIKQGATTARPEPESLPPGSVISEEDRAWWSFQPVRPPAVPQVASDRVRTPIDAFLIAEMRSHGMDYAPEADRPTLIRRLTLDLTGVPPTPEDVAAFVADSRPDAYEQLVDRLLASKSYGERWARHWLDVVGYADSNGYAEADSVRPHAWHYRDYVIRAFNDDKPWNEFIQEQLAGDEMAGATHASFQQAVLDPKKRDQLTGTGFLRMAPDGTGDKIDDPKLARNQVIAEQIKITTSSLLGLTVACAQCHDHRYDPITHEDYFRLRAIFDPAYDWEQWRTPAQRQYSLYTPEESAKAAEIEKQAKAIDDEAAAMSKKFLDEIFEVEILKLPEEERAPFREARATPADKRNDAQKALIKKYPSALATYSLDLYDKKKQNLVDAKKAEATKLRGTKPKENFLMAMTEVKGRVPVSKLFNRGDHDQPKQELSPGEIGVLSSPEIEPFKPAVIESGSSGRRLTYAQWLTNGRHPLVARALVNRFWMHHLGRGIVNTPGDFGRQGDLPSHPALLDWLADSFVKNGWKLKPLHRVILLSSAYRQSSVNPVSMEKDRDNRYYARFQVKRLDAETLRDSVLATTGKLNVNSFGPPSNIGRDPAGRIVLGIDKGDINNFKVESGGEDDFRRSIYVQVRRSKPVTVLETFDAPSMVPNCEVRSQSTVAPQSLLMMNDVFILENSRRLAERLEAKAPGNIRGQLEQAWELLFLGKPTEEELQKCEVYLKDQSVALAEYHQKNPPKKDAPQSNASLEAMASLCQILYSSNRFLYIE
ncbi:MAG: PSD1 domain-containing protein [Akkermansiaceae bacterium]|nr:PSD1 domain-containing protein [Akkermansiaceae bacterium]